MKKFLVTIVTVFLLSSVLRAAVFPADSDLWTEDSAYASSWWAESKVDPCAPDATYVLDPNESEFGNTYVEMAEVSSTYPFAYIEFPDGPIDLSAAYARVDFYIKAAANVNLPVQIRLYTDATGVYGSYFYVAPGSLIAGQWTRYNFLASAYSNEDGTPDLSHVYGIGFMGCPGTTTEVTYSIDGLHLIGQTTSSKCRALYPADGDIWTEDDDYSTNWTYVEGKVDPCVPNATYLTDCNAQIGSTYVKSAAISSTYPFVYYALPGGAPVDLSGVDSRVDFYIKAVAAVNLHLQIRLYTDATGIYGSYYYLAPGDLVPGNWKRYDYLASDYSNEDGTPDLSHVYGIGFMAAQGTTTSATFEFDGLRVGKTSLSHGHEVLLQKGLLIESIAPAYYWDPPYGDINLPNWEASNFNSINSLYSAGTLVSNTNFSYWLSTDFGNVVDYRQEPYLATVQFWDEQNILVTADWPGFAEDISYAKTLYPYSIVYMNNSPTNHYQDSIFDVNLLKSFAEVVEPEMLHYTEYPFRFQGITGSAQNYVGGSPTPFYVKMEMYRQAGLAGLDGTGATPVPTGMYVQHYHTTEAGAYVEVYPDQWLLMYNTREPSESELNLQAFAGWAFGFKKTTGYYYADYFNDPNRENENISFSDFIGDSNPTAKLYEIGSINQESQNLADALVRLLSTDVRMEMGRHADGVTNTLPSSIYAGVSVKAFNATPLANPYMTDVYVTDNPAGINDGYEGDVVIGFFRSIYDQPLDAVDANETYFMVVNGLSDAEANSVDCTQTIHIEFDFGTSGIGRLLRLNRTTGDWEVVEDGPGHAWYYYGAGGRYYLELELGGGKGDLFKYYTFYGFVPQQSLTPRKANSPSPVNGGTSVSLTADLSWIVGDGAISHDVYFGTNQTNVADANHSSAEFKGNQIGTTTYDPGTLTNDTYYWRIDEVGTDGTTKGTVWIFTTIPVTKFTDGFETSFEKWTDGGTTDWDRTTSYMYSGSYSAHAGSSDNDLISDNIDTSGYYSMTITFWYMDDDIDDDDNIYLQLYDGSAYDNKFELGNTSPEDTWHKYEVTIYNTGSDAQYFRSNFRLKFEGTSIDLFENLWLDDVSVTVLY